MKALVVAASLDLNEGSIASRIVVDSIRSPAHVLVKDLRREQVRTAVLFREKEQTG